MAENNPLVNEGFLSKIKKGNAKKQKELKTGYIESHLLGMNDALRICANACGCCWDKAVPTEFNDIAEYVAKRSRIGHTSVLEHSNFVVYLKIENSFEEDLIQFLDTVRYLNTKIIKTTDEEKTYWNLIIGGSFRGYADLYRETDDLNNAVLKAITGILYTYAHSAAFEDICELGLLNKSIFMNVEPDENFRLLNALESVVETDLFDIIGMDSITKLYTNIYSIDPELASKLTTSDLIKFTTISVMFKNMSRTCTHQLVRHRNAITQESQRYVDYSEACFNSPEIFKPDKYDADHKYMVRFAGSAPMNLTLSEIGKAICDIYGMLHNPATVGAQFHLLKEDARAFLPSNVQCKKIYMTFTLKNFLKFLNLREDKHAQAEIRMYAVAIGDWFRSNSEFTSKEICDLYTNPRLLIEDPFKIDVDEGIIEEQFEVTEDDYIRAAGLDKEDDSGETTEEE